MTPKQIATELAQIKKQNFKTAGGVQEIPQDLALHPGRRRRPGEAAAAQHPDPAADRQRSAAALRAPRSSSTTKRPRPPSSRRRRRATSASSSTKTRRRSKQAKALLEKDDSTGQLEEGRQEVLDRPDDQNQRRPAAGLDRRTARRRTAQQRRSSAPRKARSSGRSRRPAATTSSRSKKQRRRKSSRWPKSKPQISTQLTQQAQQEVFTAVRRRLQQQVAVADLLRLGLRDRTLRQLQGQRPSGERPARLLRSEPQRRPPRSLPGAGPAARARLCPARSRSLLPQGQRLPQRPQPAGLKEAAAAATALPDGVIPGAGRCRRPPRQRSARALARPSVLRPVE